MFVYSHLVPTYIPKTPVPVNVTGSSKRFYTQNPELPNNYREYQGEDPDEGENIRHNEEENDEDIKAFIGRSKGDTSEPLIKSKTEEMSGSKRMMPLRALDAIYHSHKFPNEPDSKEIIDRFDAPTRIGYQYGQLIWGWFIAPLDGEYVFYTACDDACDLYMSPDEGKDHIRKIISQNRWSLHNQWDK